MRGALEGVRVVDAAIAMAGPFVTRLLADFGAEVIRVEALSRPHRCRLAHFPDARPDKDAYWEQGATHHEQHRNKLGIAIELTNPRGREVFKKLVAISDVVVENSPPRVMKRFELDYPHLREVNPGIIMFSTTGYGHGGPYSAFRAYGMLIEAMGGLSSMMGYESPRRGTVPFPDPVAGYHGAFAVLAALRQRRRTGKGQWIDLSQYEATIGHLGEAFADYTMNGRLGKPMGNRDGVMAPHGCYPCQGLDKWVNIAVCGDEQWRSLCAVMGDPAWCRDGRFATAERRRANEDELDSRIGEWTATQDQSDVVARLQRKGVAAGPAHSMKGMLLDPHLHARGMFKVVEHQPTQPGVGRRLISGPAWQLSETPGTIRKCAPTFGQHNEQVLCDLLGMTAEELRQLEDAGAVGTKPLPWAGKPPAEPTTPEEALKAGRIVEYDPDYKEILGRVYGKIG